MPGSVSQTPYGLHGGIEIEVGRQDKQCPDLRNGDEDDKVPPVISNTKKTVRFIDLFCGIGGFRYALFEQVYHTIIYSLMANEALELAYK